MIVSLELNSDCAYSDSAIERNLEAMDWAIKHCPAHLNNAMVDNKCIIERIMTEYKLQKTQ